MRPRTVALSAAVAVPLMGASLVLGVTTEDVTQHNGLATTDPAHLRMFTDHRPLALVDAAKTVTTFGAAPMLAVLAVSGAGLLWWRGQRVVVAIAPGIALAIAAIVASVAKQIVDRGRPPVGLRLVNATEPSFPSGHATDSAAFFLALALIAAVFVLRRPLARAGVLAAAAATTAAVGLSRLVLGVHWPTDVAAGWALGTVAALLVTIAVLVVVHLTPPDTRRAFARRAGSASDGHTGSPGSPS